MNRFGIFSPVIFRKDIPSILMNEAYSPDSRNVRIRDGVVVRTRMRDVTLTRTQYPIASCTISCPTTGTISIAGVHDTEFAVSSTIAILRSDLTAGTITNVGSFDVTAITTAGSGSYTVATVSGTMTSATVAVDDIMFKSTGASSTTGEVLTPDGNPVLKYGTLSQQINGIVIETLFAFTKAHVYRWKTDDQTWTTVHTCASDCTYWSVLPYNNKMLATNGVDVPLVWTAYETPFLPMTSGTAKVSSGTCTVSGTICTLGVITSTSAVVSGDYLHRNSDTRAYRVASATSTTITLTETYEGSYPLSTTAFVVYDGSRGPKMTDTKFIRTAAHIYSFENHVFLGRITVYDSETGNTAYYLGGIAWSALGDEFNWLISSNDAGAWNSSSDATTYYLPGADYVSGFGAVDGTLIIFKEGSIHSLWSVSTALIWNTQQLDSIVGCKAPDSIIADAKKHLYFFATDMSIREIRGTKLSIPLRPIMQDVPVDLVPGIRSLYVRENQELWWAIPTPVDGVAPDANNVVIAYDTETQIWSEMIFPVTAFGQYSNQFEYTWDTLPYLTWDSWPGTWDGAQLSSDWPMDLAGGANGETYLLHSSNTDIGEVYSGTLVITTDLAGKQKLGDYKRVQAIEILASCGSSTDEMTVEIRSDGGSFVSVGTISLYQSSQPQYVRKRLSFDIRGEAFEIRFTAGNYFEFLGCIFDFVMAGQQ